MIPLASLAGTGFTTQVCNLKLSETVSGARTFLNSDPFMQSQTWMNMDLLPAGQMPHDYAYRADLDIRVRVRNAMGQEVTQNDGEIYVDLIDANGDAPSKQIKWLLEAVQDVTGDVVSRSEIPPHDILSFDNLYFSTDLMGTCPAMDDAVPPEGALLRRATTHPIRIRATYALAGFPYFYPNQVFYTPHANIVPSDTLTFSPPLPPTSPPPPPLAGRRRQRPYHRSPPLLLSSRAKCQRSRARR